MDLHTGVPLWRSEVLDPLSFSTAEGDLSCEVAVIGGGITGALVSFLLVKAGVDTLLVDKRTPGEGSTMGSTGLLQYEVDTPLVDLIDKVGVDHAVHAYRRGLTAINEIEELVDLVGGSCDFSRRHSLYFASRPEHLRNLERECDCRRQYGFDVRFLSQAALLDRSTISAPGATWSAGDAQINPYRFTHRLLKRAQQGGLRVFSNSAIQSLREDSRGVTLTTHNATIFARAAVLATGYEANEQFAWSPGDLKSTYAVATEPMKSFDGWPEGGLIWETSRPYFYARQSADGRAIIGGEDTPHSDDHTNQELLMRKCERLVERFKTLFPQLSIIPSYVWAGTFAETKDGLAYIGKVPKRSSVYAALGYGGNGITFSAIAAKLIVDLYVGRPNADAPVFSFER